ncbi:DNRLRE domain-containing protein [Streptomyces sp. NPDC005784]|uniref:DNRLRE domain-containing protein n=1 Tax=Streptomyces sp. NPDC005784 TaxID=3364731 RepID=UPI0036B8AC36
MVTEGALIAEGSGLTFAVAPESSASAASASGTPSGPAEARDEVSALMMARSQDRKIEVLSERTSKSTTYALPSGALQTESYGGPIRVKQDGQWKDIDTSLSDTGDALEPKAAAADVAVSDGGDTQLASVAKGKESFGLGWENKLPTPSVKDDTASYNLGDGQNLAVTALAQGFSENIKLSQQLADGSASYRIPLNLDGLKLSQADSGHLLLKNPDGDLVAEAPAPMMWDDSKDPASGESAHRQRVDTKIETGSDGSQTLVLTPDKDFLATATYPVTIDPTSTLAVTTDTWVQNPDYPDSQVSSPELKSGTYDAGTDVARSYLKFDVSPFTGKHIIDTNLALYSYYSSTCATTGAGTQVRRITSDWSSSSVTWAAQPTTTTTGAVTNTAALGYSSSCPAGTMNFDIDAIVQAWADGSANYGLQVRGASETDATTWRRFRSANYISGDDSVEPHLTVTYNSYPTTASAAISPSAVNAYNGNRYVTSLTPTVSAKVTDPDGSATKAQVEFTPNPAWVDTSFTYTATTSSVASGSTAKLTIPAASAFPAGVHLRYRVRAYDGTDYGTWSGYTNFTLNTGLPVAPAITCPSYPSGSWTSKASGSVTCTLDTTSTDGQGFYWGLDNPAVPNHVYDTVDGNGGDPLTISINPANGWHTLYARTLDSGANVSAATTAYSFGVGTAALNSPSDQDVTASDFTLQVTSPSGPSKVTFQYRKGNSGTFTDIPAGDVKKGTSSVSWPVAVNTVSGGVQSPALTWSVTHTVADDGLLQIKAVLTDASGNNPITTAPVNVTLDRVGAGVDFGTTQAGPVTVGLQSGNGSVTASDVSVASFGSGLGLARAFNSLSPAVPSLFGPGWTTSLPVQGTSAAWASLTDATSYVMLTGADGSKLTFTTGSTDSNGVVSYTPQGPAVAAGLTLTEKSSAFTLTDDTGTQVTFTSPGGAAGQYLPATVTQAGSARSTSYVYDTTALDVAYGKPVLVVAPDANAPAGTLSTTACPNPPTDTTWTDPGCRGLQLSYDTATGNVSEADFVTSDGTKLTKTPVAKYSYDTSGRLIAEWDPRISPALKATYTYDENSGDADYGRLTLISPAQSTTGTLAPWILTYNAVAGSADYGKLASVSHAHTAANGGGTAKTVVTYRVPLTTAAGGPANMDAATVGTWGQTDVPVSAVAVFPPDHVPTANPPLDWTYAQIQYYDADGREVNDASYSSGWNISTTEYDQYGNTVRELTAANRATALAASDSVTTAGQLDTRNLYSADGTRLIDTYGPAHNAVAAGSYQVIRSHTHSTYDEGAPNSDNDVDGQPYNLVTTETETGSIGSDVPGSSDVDARTTQNLYANGTDTFGWTLHTPLRSVTDPGTGKLNITKSVVYNEDAHLYDGQPLLTESRMPSNTGGGDAGTSKTVYYTADANSVDSDCGNKPAWTDLACKTKPAAQPGTSGLPGLAVTTYTYDRYLQPVTETETFTAADGTTSSRTASATFDGAEREIGTSIRTSGKGMGTALPDSKIVYDPATGVPTDTQSVSAQGAVLADLKTAYDDFGAISTYTDASSNVTRYTYDLASRVISRDDGKGITSFAYNEGNDHTGGLTSQSDTQAGAFGITHDADGNIATQTYPGGTVATYAYDATDRTTGVTYSNPPAWGTQVLADNADADSHGAWANDTALTSDQTFSYDAANRLTAVADDQLGQCTTRSFDYDANSNRTSIATSQPAVDGSCQQATSTKRSMSYDAADRLSDPGYQYDTQGDTITTPAQDAGGTDLTATYFANDMIASQTQGGATMSWSYDPQGVRPASTTDTAGTTHTDHYADETDTPVWTSGSDGSWQRNVNGPSGTLAAQASDKGLTLDLVNLHGDVFATVNPTTSSVTSTFTYTEFGAPETGTNPVYGWLGGLQRSGAALGGQLQMGARMYNPSTGRFSQTDPVAGGSANAYDYANQDPVNQGDPSGAVTAGCHTYNKSYKVYEGSVSVQIATIQMAIGVCINKKGHITSTTAQSWYDQTGTSAGLGWNFSFGYPYETTQTSTHIKWKTTGMGQVCWLKYSPICGYQERYQMTMDYYGSYNGPVPARYSPIWHASCTNSGCGFRFR